jgi:predicted porin
VNELIRNTARRALAAAASLALGSAVAQTSGVTLSGIADGAARYVDNSGSGGVKSLVSGSYNTSRLVFRGIEDLGSGLWAGFHLEHGLLLDSGTGASSTMFWDRRSTISLGSRTWGELRAGRDYVPSYLNWSRYDPFGYVGVAGSNNLVSARPTGPIRSAFSTSPNTTVRSSNSIQWLMPSTWGGFEGGVMVAASEGGTAADNQHKVIGARLGWSTSGFGVSAASTRTENNLTTSGSFRDHAVGANADFGFARVGAAFRLFEQADAEQRNIVVGVTVPFGQNEVKASWNRADLDGRVGSVSIDGNGAQQWGLGFVHHLSKRTAIYATAARIDNKGTVAFVIPGGSTITAGGKSTGVETGMRHVF